MKITIKMGSVDFCMPVPLRMAGLAIRAIPEKALEELRQRVAAPYGQMLCKENLMFLYESCSPALADCNGLELIHVENRDGTYISVVL